MTSGGKIWTAIYFFLGAALTATTLAIAFFLNWIAIIPAAVSVVVFRLAINSLITEINGRPHSAEETAIAET